MFLAAPFFGCGAFRFAPGAGPAASQRVSLSGPGFPCHMDSMKWMDRIRHWARELKREVVAVWIAARDPRTPLAAKLVGGMVAAYALSPIDLIPDFIPVLGYIDDLLIVPLGLMLAVRLIPAELMAEFRQAADKAGQRPRSLAAALVIVAIWLLCGAALGVFLLSG